MIAPDATTFNYLKGRQAPRHCPPTSSPPPCHLDRPTGVERSQHQNQLAAPQTTTRRSGISPCRTMVRARHRRGRNLRPRTHHRRFHPRAIGHLAAHRPAWSQLSTAQFRPSKAQPTKPLANPARAAHSSSTWTSKPGHSVEDIKIDVPSSARTAPTAASSYLRAAAKVVDGYHVATTVRAMVVPGSQAVKHQAEQEGLDRIFKSAGFEWREPGCSMCLGMNPDILSPGERCASTSNRNFEGRQGRGGRTHLLSPAMAAAAAITGHLTDVRTWKFNNSER